MASREYRYKSEFAERHFAMGYAKGFAKGWARSCAGEFMRSRTDGPAVYSARELVEDLAEGLAEGTIELLEYRRFTVDGGIRMRIGSRKNVADARRMLDRAALVASPEELFD
ncbi:hypothetical protein [Actinomadura parmotrematis]|uniref:Uncharacterized protein n=1 Tax=Actinomadura parmotrematis TaxID=2864039 RepID=A0ABS7FW36_9ACTN|nr:hypothetical protein [Actinomadura parmotrematis]MBW8484648.1 hypothetical protein [Actinomadura parmotrematis]